MTARIGVLGLGAMGGGIAANLVDAGFDVAGFDLDPARIEALRARGGHAATSPADAARGARWVLTCLPKHADVRSVTLGEEGLLAGVDPGTVFVDTSTSLPDQTRELASQVAACGVRFVDASISGTGETVKTRDIVLLVGGEKEDVAACAPLFEATARRIHHLGPVGSGALAKLVVNVAVVGNRLALAEALSFGMSAGMDGDAVLEVLKDGSSYSRAMDLKGHKMIRRDYAPESTLDASVNGSTLLLDQARQHGAPMFLTSLYAQVARVGVGLGYGEADPAALIEALVHMSDRRSET